MTGAGSGDERVDLLSRVAVALSSAPTVEAVMEELVASLAPALCDACEVVLVRGDGALERVAAGPGAYANRRNLPIVDAPDHPVRTVIASGQPLLIRRDQPNEERLFGPADVPDTAAYFGIRSAILAPMRAQAGVVGVFVVAQGPSERDWRDGDAEFVTSIATLAGLALEHLDARSAAADANARLAVLLDRQAHIARTLQGSLLPRHLPEIPSTEVVAHYWPAIKDLEVSGDFYDVFPLGGSAWGLLVGDVCGKGVEAAAATSTARHTARAAALHLDDPAEVLRWVHEAVAALDLTFCTIAHAQYDHETGELRVALGGHPPGILVRADGSVERLGRPGSLLGVVDPDLHTTSTTIGPGDLFAFFTDGITDVPRGGDMDADELASFLRDAADLPLEDIGARLREVLVGRRPEGFTDDIALLLVRRV